MLKKIPRQVWIFLLPVLLGLPFIGRAYFVDDHYHMLMARGILEHPLRPYDFKADDAGADNAGWERGQPPRMVNPPIHHYLLALLWKTGGERPWVVRLGVLLLSGLSALFLYRLAQWFLIPPEPAVILSVLTPAFWLSSYSLLIDPTMLTFFLGGLWAWIEGSKKRSFSLLVFSGILMGLTILTKYTGAFVIPLALVWWFLQDRSERRWASLSVLAIPVGMLALWSLWNMGTYGAPHLTESSKRALESFQVSRVPVFLIFFSGVLGVPLLSWGRTHRPLFPIALCVMLAMTLASPWGGYTPLQAFLMAFFAFGGLLFFAGIARQTAGPLSRPADRFLVFWLLLGSGQMIFVMGWVAARYYLTLVPPVVFLTCRWLGVTFRHSPSRRNAYQTILAVGLFMVSLAAAMADFAQAEVNRRIVDETARDGWLSQGRRCFFLGDSFTGSYLKTAGWQPAFPETDLAPGDLVLSQQVVMPRWWFRPTPDRFRLVKSYEFSSRWPVRVMDNHGSAGFYASAWGALPYTLSKSPLERYLLLEVLPEK